MPHNLQIREYHSPERSRNALERIPLYKRVMQILKVKWIGLKLSPPLLLDLKEGRNEEEERKQWKNIRKDEKLYPQEGTQSAEPWDVREATRAMKYMDIDE